MKPGTLLKIVASLVCCILAVEAGFAILLSMKPSRGEHGYQRRKVRWNLGEAASTPSSTPLRIPSSLDRLPVLRAFPSRQESASRSELNSDRRYHPGLFAKDGLLAPGHLSRSVLEHLDGTVVYDVGIATDERGRRVTSRLQPAKETRHLAIFGCSFVFGEGVENESTLPSQIAALSPHYRVFNYGRPGAGPSEVLSRIRDADFPRELEFPQGRALYLFIPDHVRRVPPSLYSLQGRMHSRYYFEKSDGTIGSAKS